MQCGVWVNRRRSQSLTGEPHLLSWTKIWRRILWMLSVHCLNDSSYYYYYSSKLTDNPVRPLPIQNKPEMTNFIENWQDLLDRGSARRRAATCTGQHKEKKLRQTSGDSSRDRWNNVNEAIKRRKEGMNQGDSKTFSGTQLRRRGMKIVSCPLHKEWAWHQSLMLKHRRRLQNVGSVSRVNAAD
jgi:hypothetical protein